MSDGILSDSGVADQLAVGLEQGSVSAAESLPYTSLSTMSALVEGVSLGNSLKATFDQLETAVDSKANNLREIAAAFDKADQELAGGG